MDELDALMVAAVEGFDEEYCDALARGYSAEEALERAGLY